jgi:hypothetical protein
VFDRGGEGWVWDQIGAWITLLGFAALLRLIFGRSWTRSGGTGWLLYGSGIGVAGDLNRGVGAREIMLRILVIGVIVVTVKSGNLGSVLGWWNVCEVGKAAGRWLFA